MDDRQLRDRMNAFIESEYRAYVFEVGKAVVGYALVNHARTPLYLRQFYIGREHRRQGCGREAFHQLRATLGATDLDLEVLVSNERGRRFWRSLGFRERSLYMRISDACAKS
ncbi:GNAT family N-acetyltransferase [Paenibacillus sp. LHD-117]|uniref:GNAT family N-acetyltransferase n=1 Tax=Paenibacillus sp. LHD-117 TaxID=3071412 RepID=UPI0027E081B3|nr:GNAT family N-acetyltransferase [Paenibacillus sp. LHD-117]MDQ6421589.1 GNAT family N-acetyltransferase [Paenibacillus sp. LHD-117]